MADIYAIFGSLVLLGLSYPALLTAWWLLFPTRVEAVRLRVTEYPRRSLGVGFLGILIAAVPGGILFALPSQFTQVLAWIWLVIILGAASIGGAGIAAELGLRLNWKNDGAFLSLGAFLRGALIWELAAVFPLIGWLLIIPLGTLISLGGLLSTIIKRKSSLQEN
jgi:hypothetical protein